MDEPAVRQGGTHDLLHHTMNAIRIPRVAFTFVNDGKEWYGGLNYFRSLFLALESIPADERRVEAVAFLGKAAAPGKLSFPASLRITQDAVFDRLSARWLFNKLAVRATGRAWLSNRVLRKQGIDVLSHSGPSGDPRLPSIGWIPDFQHLHLPQFFPQEELESRSRLYRQLIEQSEIIVLSSESARRDFERFAPGSTGKARVLRFCAVRPALDASIDVAALYGLDAPYFYIPNQVWAHKNHVTAVRALAQIADRHPAVKIVCSGTLADYRNPGHVPALLDEIAERGLVDRFLMMGVIPYAHIAPLMFDAVAVINPSLFEGWSTSVEEAKALGTPLILSGIDVHREQCVAGEATFFDPMDASGLAARMDEALRAPADAGSRDPRAALEKHRQRSLEFARAYEGIVHGLLAQSLSR